MTEAPNSQPVVSKDELERLPWSAFSELIELAVQDVLADPAAARWSHDEVANEARSRLEVAAPGFYRDTSRKVRAP